MRHFILVFVLAATFSSNMRAAESKGSIPSTEDERFAYAYGLTLRQYLSTLKLSEREMEFLLRAMSQGAPEQKLDFRAEDYSGQKGTAWAEKRRTSGSTQSLDSTKAGKGDPELCKLYQELSTHPDLKDFPIVIDKLENGYATLVGLKASNWANLGGVSLDSAFGNIEKHRGKARLAQGVAQRVTGKEAAWREYNTSSAGEVSKWAEEKMRVACGMN